MAAGYFSYFGVKDYTLTDDMQKKMVDISQYSAIFSSIADDVSFYSYYTMQDGERLDTISQKLYSTPQYYWTIPLINSNITNIFRDLPKDYQTFINYLQKKYPGSAFKLAANQSIAGKFNIGEVVSYSNSNTAIIIGKFPTNGYLQVQVINGSFPTNSPFTIIGNDTKDTVTISAVTTAYEAPAYYIDANGNQVRWNKSPSQSNTPVMISDVELDANLVSSQIKVIRPKYIYDVAKRFESQMKTLTTA